MASWLNFRLSPLLCMVFPPEYTYEDLDAAFQDLETHYRREVAETTRPIGLLVDVSAITKSSARNRKRVIDAISDLVPLVRDRTVGQAYVVRGELIRGALTAIFWLREHPWPTKFFTSRVDAEVWLRARFSEAGHTVPT